MTYYWSNFYKYWLGVVHILRDQLRGGGVPNDYASVILTQLPEDPGFNVHKQAERQNERGRPSNDTIAMCKTNYGEGGGGGKNVPKTDYIICEQPLKLYNLLVNCGGL